MASKKAERVVEHLFKRMQGAEPGTPLPGQRTIRSETGLSSATIVQGYQLAWERGYVFKAGESYFWGHAGTVMPLPLRREDRVAAGSLLGVRENFLDPFAAHRAATLVREGNGVLRQKCKDEVTRIDKELGTRSLAVHQAGDWRFHHLLWFSGGDRIVMMIARGIETALRRSIHSNVVAIGSARDMLVGRAVDHKNILAYVILGEADAAREAAIQHVKNVRDRLGRSGCEQPLV